MLPKDLPLIVLKKKDQQNNYKHFIVNRNRVQVILQWLCNNNPEYKANNIRWNENLINALPENDVPNDLQEIIDDNQDQFISDEGPEIGENDINNLDVWVIDNWELKINSNDFSIFRKIFMRHL